MTRLPCLLLLPVLCAAAVACGSPAVESGSVTATSQSGQVKAHVEFEGNVRRGENALFVDFVSAAAAVASVQLVAASAYMPAHGHVASAEQIADDEDVFHASGLDLFMTGRWEVELALHVDDEQDWVSFPVDVP